MNKREQLIESIHATIKSSQMTPGDVILSLAQVMTDLGLTLWRSRKDSGGLTLQVTPEFLKRVEAKHYEKPGVDTALILQAATMITWAEDWVKSK